MIQKFQLLVIRLFQNRGNSQSKSSILNFFAIWENTHPIIRHTQKVAKHLHKHHKKYLRWSTIWFLIIKIFATLLTTVWGWTFAAISDNQYYIWDSIISQYEQCDDWNLQDLDGCSSLWEIESWANCIWEPSICSFVSIENTIQTWAIEETWSLITTW